MALLTRCGTCGSELNELNESDVVCATCGACQSVDQFYHIDWRVFEDEAAAFEEALKAHQVEEFQDLLPDEEDCAKPIGDDLVLEGIEAACLLEGARLALFMANDDADGYIIQ